MLSGTKQSLTDLLVAHHHQLQKELSTHLAAPRASHRKRHGYHLHNELVVVCHQQISWALVDAWQYQANIS